MGNRLSRADGIRRGRGDGERSRRASAPMHFCVATWESALHVRHVARPGGCVEVCHPTPRCFLELQVLHTSIVCPIPPPPLFFNFSTHFFHLFVTMNDSSSTRLQLLFDAALQSYEKQTGLKLIDHPLARQLENCHTADSVMDTLQHQAWANTGFREEDGKIMRSLKQVVHVLDALSTSTTLGEGIGLVCLM